MFFPEPSDIPDQSLMKAILEPLLDDFQYWFSEAKALLASPKADCLVAEQRKTLMERIGTAQKEVSAARILFAATDGQAGVDMAMVMNWHQLVSQYWRVSSHIRQINQGPA